jgi:DNA processing protein
MPADLLYQIALTLVPNIGDVHAKALVNIYGDAQSIFKAKKKELEAIEGIGTVRANSIKAFTDFTGSEAEIKFIEKYKIAPFFLTDKNYPQRLLNCYDSPVIMYYRGTANLNSPKIISIVGTRNCSEYGKAVTEKLIADLTEQNILVVSGLAFGIDTIAHKAAIKNNLQTVGVLAHGLDTNPDKQNFPKRNRIVAGMCDALIVIESGKKGGSLITAELANGYNKDVFAIPGKVTDTKSEGCNYLIKQNKASLITCATDLIELMNWDPKEKNQKKKQRELFIELTTDEKIIVDILQQRENIQIDELYFKSGLSSSAAATALLMLEMQNVVLSLPGKVYKMA